MKACRSASVVATAALLAAGAVGACREASRPDVPPVTIAHPSPTVPVLSGPATHPNRNPAEPAAPTTEADAGTRGPLATIVEGTRKIEVPVCSRAFVVAAKGSATVRGGAKDPPDTLVQGDVLVVTYPDAMEVTTRSADPARPQDPGLAVHVYHELDCREAPRRGSSSKTIVRAREVPELRWAGGAMRAQMLVTAKDSPELYLGRLEGTAAVPEHEHATASETLITIEAAGTVTVNGLDVRLGPKQVFRVARGQKHAWKPDPGSKLVAIQLYDPPGPEQRFAALAAQEKDGGAPQPAKPSDAGARPDAAGR